MKATISQLAKCQRQNIQCTVAFAPYDIQHPYNQSATNTVINTINSIANYALTGAAEFCGVALTPENKHISKTFCDFIIWETMKQLKTTASQGAFSMILNVTIKYDAFNPDTCEVMETIAFNFSPNGG